MVPSEEWRPFICHHIGNDELKESVEIGVMEEKYRQLQEM